MGGLGATHRKNSLIARALAAKTLPEQTGALRDRLGRTLQQRPSGGVVLGIDLTTGETLVKDAQRVAVSVGVKPACLAVAATSQEQDDEHDQGHHDDEDEEPGPDRAGGETDAAHVT